jgi:excisionase family DNA binding protein
MELPVSDRPTRPMMYTVKEAADQLRVSESTIRKMLCKQQIGNVKVCGRVFISDDDIAAFLKANHRGPRA